MKIKTILAAIAFLAVPALTFADPDFSHEQRSDELGKKISVVAAEIKTLKAKKKAEPSNLQIPADLAAKQAELKQLKQEKAVYDTAIKARKKAEKQTKQAKKAAAKHEKAAAKAATIKTGIHAGKSNQAMLGELESKIDVLDAEIKALKAKKKANPSDITVTGAIAAKQAELKEAKRQKSIISNAIKAEQDAEKEKKDAEKAAKKHNEAADNVSKMQQGK